MAGLAADVIHVAAVVAYLTALIFAALYDLTTYRIPNGTSVAVVVSFAASAATSGLAPTEILLHVGAGLTMLSLGVALFALRLIGGGDAKLLASVALWMGFHSLPVFLVVVALLGGVLAAAIVFARRISFPPSWHGVPWLARLIAPGQGLPYGVAISAGAVIVVLRLGGADPLLHIGLAL